MYYIRRPTVPRTNTVGKWRFWVSYMSSIPTSITTCSPGLNAGRPKYGQLAHRNASPKKQLPQLLVAFLDMAAALISRCLSSSPTTTASPSTWALSMTVFPCFASSASISARPHVQPLQAFLRRGAPSAINGSHVGTGRARSEG